MGKKSVIIVTSVLLLLVIGSYAIILPKLPQVLTLLGVTGKFSIGLVEPLEVGKPNLKDVRVNSQGLSLVVELPVHNPNPYAAEIETVKGDLYFNGYKISRHNVFKGQNIPPRTTQNVTITVNSNIQKSLKSIPKSFLNIISGESNSLAFKGYLETNIAYNKLKIPIKADWHV